MRQHFLRPGTTLAISVGMLGCGVEDLPLSAASPLIEVRADPPGTSFIDELHVALHTDRPARIFYTLQGESPSGTASRRYEGPLVLREATLLSFVAEEHGVWSKLGSEFYQPIPVEKFEWQIPARRLEVSDSILFFAATTGHEPVRQVLELRSTGLLPAFIGRMYIGPHSDAPVMWEKDVFSLGACSAPVPGPLRPGESIQVEIVYQPRNTLRAAVLVIESDDVRAVDAQHVIELWGRVPSL